MNIQILKGIRSSLVQHLQHVRQLLAMRSLLCSRWRWRSWHYRHCSTGRWWSIRYSLSLLLLPTPNSCKTIRISIIIQFFNLFLNLSTHPAVVLVHGTRKDSWVRPLPTEYTWAHWDSSTDSIDSWLAGTDILQVVVAAAAVVSMPWTQVWVMWCYSSPSVPSWPHYYYHPILHCPEIHSWKN